MQAPTLNTTATPSAIPTRASSLGAQDAINRILSIRAQLALAAYSIQAIKSGEAAHEEVFAGLEQTVMSAKDDLDFVEEFIEWTMN